MLGLLSAVTPMVLFIGSVLNSSGLDIAASVACAAAVLRIARAPERAPRWMWAAFAGSGAVTVLSWQLGPWFVVLILALGAAMLGRAWRGALRECGRRAAGAGLTLVAAFALYLIYGLSSGLMHASFSVTPIGGSLSGGVRQLRNVLPDAVGNFGSRTVPLPTIGYWAWWLGALALLAGALWVGRPRDRTLLAFLALLALGFPVLFYAAVYRHTGAGLQGRHVLPVLMLVPLMAGEVIQRASAWRQPRAATVLATAVIGVGAFQLYAWWINARHSAREPHAVWFLSHPQWSPPLGWWPWTLLAVLGTTCLGAAAFALRSAGQRILPLAPSHQSQ